MPRERTVAELLAIYDYWVQEKEKARIEVDTILDQLYLLFQCEDYASKEARKQGAVDEFFVSCFCDEGGVYVYRFGWYSMYHGRVKGHTAHRNWSNDWYGGPKSEKMWRRFEGREPVVKESTGIGMLAEESKFWARLDQWDDWLLSWEEKVGLKPELRSLLLAFRRLESRNSDCWSRSSFVLRKLGKLIIKFMEDADSLVGAAHKNHSSHSYGQVPPVCVVRIEDRAFTLFGGDLWVGDLTESYSLRGSDVVFTLPKKGERDPWGVKKFPEFVEDRRTSIVRNAEYRKEQLGDDFHAVLLTQRPEGKKRC